MHVRWWSFAAGFLIACGGFGAADEDTQDEPPVPAEDAGSDATVNGTVGDGTLTVDAIGTTFVTQGTNTKVTVKIQRGASVIEDVVLSATGLRDGITATGTIPAGSREGQLVLSVPAAAAQGDLPLTIQATVPSSVLSPAPNGTAPAALFVRGKPGALDTTFGKAGVQVQLFRSPHQAFGLDVYADTSGAPTILAACYGDGGHACAARLDAKGLIDKTFGGDGTGFHVYDWGFGLAMTRTADGKFLVAGGGLTEPLAVARFNADGGADPTFGVNGAREFTISPGTTSDAYAVAAAPTGEFVIAFDWTINGIVGIGTTKHTSSGGFVGGYGMQNAAYASINDGSGARVTGVALRPDGRIVLAGVGNTGKSFATVQLNTDGSYDATYGSGGASKVSAPNGAHRYDQESATTLLLLGDGSVVTAFLADNGVFLVKFTPTGALDATFGQGGIGSAYDIGGGGRPCGLLRDAAGGYLVPLVSGTDAALRVARFKPDGTLDVAFGTGGVARAPGGDSRRAAIAPDGRIFVVGRASGPAEPDVMVARFWGD